MYTLSLRERNVHAENLKIGQRAVLERNADGSGKIWAEELKQLITFKIPTSELATFVRRDGVQHPFLEPLHQWASSVRRYEFGSMLGKNVLYTPQVTLGSEKSPDMTISPSTDPSQIVQLYGAGFQTFGDAFDRAILHDFDRVGYSCDDVGAYPFEDIVQHITLMSLPMGIYVKEKDLLTQTGNSKCQWACIGAYPDY
jgi:hypothetical protein